MKNPDSAPSIEIEQTEKYNFPEVESLREGLFEICEKMKGNIEANKWTKLLSDETGGRIPTLVIWNLIKHFHPNDAPEPFFLSNGVSYVQFTEEAAREQIEYLKKIVKPEDKYLLITEFVRLGTTMKSMINNLDTVGIKKENIDVAGVVSDHDQEFLKRKFRSPDSNVYVGDRHAHTTRVDVEAFFPRFTGVIQDREEYDPVPIRLVDKIKQTGSRGGLIDQDEWNEIFGITGKETQKQLIEKSRDEVSQSEHARRDRKPLSKKEKVELQDNINKAREDVNTLVREILKKIWNEA